MPKFLKNLTYIVLLLILISSVKIYAENDSQIFPIPQKMKLGNSYVEIIKNTLIAVPLKRNESETFITELIQAEFSDKYSLPLNIIKTDKMPNGQPYILAGSLKNPLIQKYCRDHQLTEKVKSLGDEGYILQTNENNIIIASKSDIGVLYGFQSFRQLINKIDGHIKLSAVNIEDKPVFPLRGIKMYLPGRDNIPFFKRFVRDFMSKYKFNTIILELNGNMRLESHPEINVGTINFGNDLNYSRMDRPAGPHKEYQNSSHQDVADGKILEKIEVKELLNYINKFNIEVIPEIPSLTHSYYLLFGHKENAELPDREYPDTYCPLKEENYKIYFDVLNEYIEVFHPKTIHVGHDEWRMEKDVCNLCKGKDYGKLYAADINKIHDFLSAKGIRMAIWGDHLLESVRKKEFRVWETKIGYRYKIPGAMRADQVRTLIPKDILIFNWFWADRKGGINNDLQVSDFGFQQIYGNFKPIIQKWSDRVKIKGLLGGAPSSWAATTEYNIGKDLLVDFLGTSNLLWSKYYQSPDQIAIIAQKRMPQIREDLSGKILPSRINLDLPVETVGLDDKYNSSLSKGIDSIDVKNLITGQIKDGKRVFNISDGHKKAIVVSSTPNKDKIKSVTGIKIGKDVSSIIFLHSCAKPEKNQKAYKAIWDFDDTAELLGWYEVVFDDGYIETIPIRYGVNILDWETAQRIINGEKGKSKYGQDKYAYNAKIISCSKNKKNPISFFAFEWKNSRFGKKIKEVNLKAVTYKKNHDNSIMLLGISTVGKKIMEKATGEETD